MNWEIGCLVSQACGLKSGLTPVCLCPSPTPHPPLAILGPSDKAELQFSWVSGLQTADHGTSQPPKLRQPISIINLLLCILLVLFLWRTLTTISLCLRLQDKLPETPFLVPGA